MLNAAIIGCGQIARAHLAALAATPGAQVVALCDRDLDRARQLAPLAPDAAMHTELGAVLSERHVDVVHVLTPPGSHGDVAIEAAEAGCNVLVEKPMALTVAEADRIIAAARTAGVVVVPNHNYLYKPSIQRARDLVARGDVGNVVAVNSFYGISGERSSYGASAGRSHWAWALPGGVFTNFLPHLAYLQLEFLGGPPQVVGAVLGGEASDPTELVVQLSHEGTLGTITVSMRTKPYMKYVEIYGTRGVVHADLVREVTYVHRDRPLPSMLSKVVHNLELVTQVTAATVSTSVQVATGRLPRMPEMRVLIGRLYESLETGTAPPTTAEEGRAAAQVLEDVRARLPAAAPPPPPAPLATRPRTDAERRAGALRGADAHVLVTGGSGFLGHHLAEALVRCGAQPVLLVRDPARIAPELVPHVRVVRGDVRDPDAVAAAVKGIDVVFHAAAVTTNKAPAVVHEETNVQATRLLIRAAVEAGVRRAVHASSVIVYGAAPRTDIVTEDTTLDRDAGRWDHYLRTKVAAEDAARAEISASDELELVILRLGILYGHERPLDPGLASVGPIRLMLGGGRNHLPYLHVDDAVDAMLLAATLDEAAGQTYNVVGDLDVRVRDLIDSSGAPDVGRRRPVGVPRHALLAGSWLLEQRAARSGTDVPPRLSRFVVRSATRDVRYATEKAHTELGWSPSTAPSEGMPR